MRRSRLRGSLQPGGSFLPPSLRLHARRSRWTSQRRLGLRSSHCVRRGRFDGRYLAHAAYHRRPGLLNNISLSCRYRGRRSGYRAAGSAAFAFLPHPPCQRRSPTPLRLAPRLPPIRSCALRRGAPFSRNRGLFRGFGGDPQNETVGEAHINGLHLPFQDGIRSLQACQSRPRSCRRLSREEHLDGIVDAKVPAPITDANGGGGAGGKIGLARQHVDELRRMGRGTIADNHRELGELVESGHWDDATVAIDQLDPTAVLPEGQRLALGHTYIERSRQTALDDRTVHPRQGFELLSGTRRTHCQDWGAGPGRKRRQDRLTIGCLSPLDHDVRNRQAKQTASLHHRVGCASHHRLAERKATQLNSPVEARQNHARNRDQQRPRMVPTRRPRSTRPPRGDCLYLSHRAFSTIQTTRSSKLMPAWRAMSGTSEVGVIPGWLFTSNR